MLICHVIFHCKLFLSFILAECEILNLVDVGKRTRTAPLSGWPLARYQPDGMILIVMQFFYLKVSFNQYSIVSPLCGNISQKPMAS